MIKIPKYEKDEMIKEIKHYFNVERGEDIGDLAAVLILDFITEKLGKYYFNKGIDEARRFISDSLEGMSEIEMY